MQGATVAKHDDGHSPPLPFLRHHTQSNLLWAIGFQLKRALGVPEAHGSNNLTCIHTHDPAWRWPAASGEVLTWHGSAKLGL